MWLYAVLYSCLTVRSVEYCTGLFVWEPEGCAHLFVGGLCVCVCVCVCVAEVLCVFVIKCLCRLWVFIVVLC